MPSIDATSQGQSDVATEIKQRGLASAFAINLSIFQRKFGSNQRAKYVHIDLNCGSGFNDEVGCIGSPLTFLHQANACGVERYAAFFVDKNRDAVRQLIARDALRGNQQAAVFNGDNVEFCRMVPDLIRSIGERCEYAVGTILSDPNGTQVPIESIAALAIECPKLDVIVNVAATGMKRAGRRIEEIRDGISKSHWLIRKPVGKWGWTQLIGRNVPYGEHRALGYFDIRSPQGAAIFHELNLTLAERQDEHNQRVQGQLF